LFQLNRPVRGNTATPHNCCCWRRARLTTGCIHLAFGYHQNLMGVSARPAATPSCCASLTSSCIAGRANAFQCTFGVKQVKLKKNAPAVLEQLPGRSRRVRLGLVGRYEQGNPRCLITLPCQINSRSGLSQ
jgi:hypothetical protein